MALQQGALGVVEVVEVDDGLLEEAPAQALPGPAALHVAADLRGVAVDQARVGGAREQLLAQAAVDVVERLGLAVAPLPRLARAVSQGERAASLELAHGVTEREAGRVGVGIEGEAFGGVGGPPDVAREVGQGGLGAGALEGGECEREQGIADAVERAAAGGAEHGRRPQAIAAAHQANRRAGDDEAVAGELLKRGLEHARVAADVAPLALSGDRLGDESVREQAAGGGLRVAELCVSDLDHRRAPAGVTSTRHASRTSAPRRVSMRVAMSASSIRSRRRPCTVSAWPTAGLRVCSARDSRLW